MATPGRRPRARQNVSVEPEAVPAGPTGRGGARKKTPSRGGSEAPQQTARRSTRQTSPIKQSQQALPELSSRTSTAYGTQGRTQMSESLGTNQSAEQMLDAIREDEEDHDDGNEEDDVSDDDEAALQLQNDLRLRNTSVAPSRIVLDRFGSRLVGGTPDISTSMNQPPNSQLYDFRSRAPAPSIDGTTVIDNAGDYAPLSNVAEDAQEVRRASRTLYAQVIRNKITQMYQRIPRMLQTPRLRRITQVLRGHRRRPLPQLFPSSRRQLLILLGTLFPLLLAGGFYKYANDFEPTTIPHSIGQVLPVDSAKHYGEAAWSSIATLTKGFTKGTKSLNAGDLLARITNLESRAHRLDNEQKFQQQTIAEVRSLIPSQLAISKENGEWQIPLDFFQALKEYLDTHATGTPDKESPSWNTFLRKNRFEVDRIVDEAIDQRLLNNAGTKRILFQDEVIQMIQENTAQMSQDFRSRVDREFEHLKDVVAKPSNEILQELTREVVAEAIIQIPWEEHMKRIVDYNIIYNHELTENAINHFSPALGAVHVPALSSTTYEKPRPWHSRYWTIASGYKPPNPPISALTKWDEPGDCWCAAKPYERRALPAVSATEENPAQESSRILNSHSGGTPNNFIHSLARGQTLPRAQITVSMPYKIFPKRFTIDHFPKSAIPDVGSAPRQIEIWAEITDATDRARVVDVANRMFNKDLVRPPGNTSHSAGVALPESFVRLGEGTYELRWPNHRQTRSITLDLESLGIGVSKIAVRAVTNWGANYTCFYRIRMHGVLAEKREDWVTYVHAGKDTYNYY